MQKVTDWVNKWNDVVAVQEGSVAYGLARGYLETGILTDGLSESDYKLCDEHVGEGQYELSLEELNDKVKAACGKELDAFTALSELTDICDAAGIELEEALEAAL